MSGEGSRSLRASSSPCTSRMRAHGPGETSRCPVGVAHRHLHARLPYCGPGPWPAHSLPPGMIIQGTCSEVARRVQYGAGGCAHGRCSLSYQGSSWGPICGKCCTKVSLAATWNCVLTPAHYWYGLSHESHFRYHGHAGCWCQKREIPTGRS